MNHYEIMFLVHPDQTGQVNTMVDRYRSMVESGGGAMHRLENLGLRPLAYPIRKVSKAHYVLMNIETTAETIGEIKNSFQFNDAVVRDMVIRCDHAVTEASPLMRSVRQEEERAAEARKQAEAQAQADPTADKGAAAAAEAQAQADPTADKGVATAAAEAQTQTDPAADKGAATAAGTAAPVQAEAPTQPDPTTATATADAAENAADADAQAGEEPSRGAG